MLGTLLVINVHLKDIIEILIEKQVLIYFFIIIKGSNRGRFWMEKVTKILLKYKLKSN